MKKNELPFLPEFYRKYINQIAEDDFMQSLKTEQAVTQQFITTIPLEKEAHRYAEGKWSVKEVFQHLVDTERIMGYRALTFARQDSHELPGFEENDYALAAKADNRTLASIAQEFALVRQATIALFESFDADMLMQSGIANRNRISVISLGFIIVGHEIHHRTILQERYFNG